MDLTVAKDTFCEIPQDASFETFYKLAQMIMNENIESPGTDINKVEQLYLDLIAHIQDIELVWHSTKIWLESYHRKWFINANERTVKTVYK